MNSSSLLTQHFQPIGALAKDPCQLLDGAEVGEAVVGCPACCREPPPDRLPAAFVTAKDKIPRFKYRISRFRIQDSSILIYKIPCF